jgi:glycogen(starch) synthase
MTAEPIQPGIDQPLDEESGDLAAGTRSTGPGLVLEFAWEVCNQVGGIYQVIRSKAPEMVERWGDRYVAVGPYEGGKADLEFEPTRAAGWVGRALTTLKDLHGITVHHGRWLIPGRPRVMLIDYAPMRERLGDVKFRLWQDHGIESPGNDSLVNDVIAFAEASRRLLEALSNERGMVPGRNKGLTRALIAHFHEWMGGLAIPMIRRKKLPIATSSPRTPRSLAATWPATRQLLRPPPWVDQTRPPRRRSTTSARSTRSNAPAPTAPTSSRRSPRSRTRSARTSWVARSTSSRPTA